MVWDFGSAVSSQQQAAGDHTEAAAASMAAVASMNRWVDKHHAMNLM